jgi:hypothetical protein
VAKQTHLFLPIAADPNATIHGKNHEIPKKPGVLRFATKSRTQICQWLSQLGTMLDLSQLTLPSAGISQELGLTL